MLIWKAIVPSSTTACFIGLSATRYGTFEYPIAFIYKYNGNLHDTSNVNESLPSWRSTYQRYPLVKTRFWCYSIHGSVNDDPVRLLFCGDLTILLLGLIIYCLFKLKRKLRHSLRRPSRSDLVQFRFVDLFVIIFYHTDFMKSIHFHLIFGILGIVRAAACQILVCYFTTHEHWRQGCRLRNLPRGWRYPMRRGRSR